jgi:hypothetical protein
MASNEDERDPIPKGDAEAAEYLNGATWEGAHQDTDTWAKDQHASAVANRPNNPPDSLFRR